MRVVALIAVAIALTPAPARAQDTRPDDVPDALERGPGIAPGETCAAAVVILSLPFSTVFDNDTFGPGGGPGSCNSAQAASMQNDGWFRWTAPSSATVTVFIDTPLYDAIVQVYRGASCGALTQVVCGDEPEPINLSFAAVSGTTYWFQLGDWGTTEGGGPTTLQITAQPLPGETCAAAGVISTLPFAAAINNDLFTADGPPGSCNDGSAVVMQNDAWYRWTADASGSVRIGLTAPYNAIVQTYSGPGCGSLSPLVCFDEPQPIQSEFPVTAGQTYWFQLGQRGIGDGGGPTTFNLSFAPPGETCASAIEITSTPAFITFNNDTATGDGPRGSCNAGAAVVMQNDRWYRWTAPVTTSAWICANFPAYDGIVQVYTGPSCISLVQFTCRDEPEPAGVSFTAFAGVTYWFQIGDWGTSEGGGETDFTLLACTGDANFDGAINFDDIVLTLANWLQVAGQCAIAGDANLDGVVNFDDIVATLSRWLGPCP